MHGGSCQFDVSHALAADLGTGHFDPATLTDNTLETNPLVLTAGALPVLGRTKDGLAEEAILLGLKCAVVDGLWLLYFTV